MLPVWLDGRLLDPDDARVTVFDHGITVGDGVFETMRTAPEPGSDRWVPFAAGRHLARLRRSLAGLGLELDRTDGELRDAMQSVADHLGGPGRIRLTVTGGTGPLGSGRSGAPLTVIVAGSEVDGWPETGACVTVPWTRNQNSAVAGLKTTSYAENVVALARAKDHGAQEALLANTAGQLCEGTGSNVFVVVGGSLRTPPLSSGCLAGITRELVCELVDVEEVDLPLAVLEEADEVFLTSSTRDVQGQHRVDDRTLDAPGPR
ncbi:MAG TPA: aminotransferase class IV, partial [Acidimicrobiales bacterium]|nr:aminotransferase class IV [Acidimicrobiales bacterium]